MDFTLSISLCVTLYNEPLSFLDELYNQSKAQKKSFKEVIIFNDNPKRKITDLRFKIINSSRNRGPAYGRNVLAKLAKGKYLKFHDLDDWLHPSTCFELSKKLSYDIVLSNVSFGKKGKKNFSNPIIPFFELKKIDLIKFSILYGLLTPSITFKKSFFKKIAGFDETVWQSEDFDIGIRASLAKPSYKIINKCLESIRSRPNSRSKNIKEVYSWGTKVLQKNIKNISNEYHPAISKKAVEMGFKLYQTGFTKDAEDAFKFASSISCPDCTSRGAIFHFISLFLGPLNTERIARIYRYLVPLSLRQKYQKQV
jgi:glycosyltransferase involved in cell wall biosynthesis